MNEIWAVNYDEFLFSIGQIGICEFYQPEKVPLLPNMIST